MLWKLHVSSPHTNFTYETLNEDIDDLMETVLSTAQEEDAYFYGEKKNPEATPSEIHEAVSHVRFKTLNNKETVKAYQAFDDMFFSIYADMGPYSILIIGHRLT